MTAIRLNNLKDPAHHPPPTLRLPSTRIIEIDPDLEENPNYEELSYQRHSHTTSHLDSANIDVAPFGEKCLLLSKMYGKFAEFRALDFRRNHKFIHYYGKHLIQGVAMAYRRHNLFRLFANRNGIFFPKFRRSTLSHLESLCGSLKLIWAQFARAMDGRVFHWKIKKILIKYSDRDPEQPRIDSEIEEIA